MIKHYEIKIFGNVQGINFRWSAKHHAQSLNLTGFVQNKPDGSVYIEAEGEESDLSKLVDWCHKGPIFASVKKVEVEEKSIKGYNTFEIKP